METFQIHHFTNQARKRLGSRQILTEESFHDDLPGGMWKMSKTRDVRLTNSQTKCQTSMSNYWQEQDVLFLAAL